MPLEAIVTEVLLFAGDQRADQFSDVTGVVSYAAQMMCDGPIVSDMPLTDETGALQAQRP